MQLALVCFRSCPTSAAPLIFKGVLKSVREPEEGVGGLGGKRRALES